MKAVLLLVATLILVTGLAHGTEVQKEPKNVVTCSSCYVLTDLLKEFVTDPANEAAVSDALKQICEIFVAAGDPYTYEQCKALFNDYVDDIIELLANQYLNPESLCYDVLGVCP